MRFWDSSAIAPLLVEEADSDLRESQLREDGDILVWYGTLVELESALNRRKREGFLKPKGGKAARLRLAQLETSWLEVQPTAVVRERALRLLRVHPLRAADAFQLGAALVVTSEQPRGCAFYTNDTRLKEAAAAEGFDVE